LDFRKDVKGQDKGPQNLEQIFLRIIRAKIMIDSRQNSVSIMMSCPKQNLSLNDLQQKELD
jgi:hypothetical protein